MVFTASPALEEVEMAREADAEPINWSVSLFEPFVVLLTTEELISAIEVIFFVSATLLELIFVLIPFVLISIRVLPDSIVVSASVVVPSTAKSPVIVPPAIGSFVESVPLPLPEPAFAFT